MNVLLVGAGPMAIAHAKALQAQGVPFEAVGRGAGSSAAFARETGVQPIEGGLARYLSAGAFEGTRPVIVAVPVPQLAEAAKQLISHGARRLLVEKPAGLDLDEIGGVAAAARTSGAAVFVAYNRRFYASVAAARTLIAEDGGVSSFHVDFSELAERIATKGKDAAILANWVLANSSHMIDLAFHLAGVPDDMNGTVSGHLPWHPAGAVFAGHGHTRNGGLFTWHADWNSAGRWGLDLRTPRRRLLLQPLEKLQVQEKSGFALTELPIDDALDRAFKPGIYRQLQAFLTDQPEQPELLRIEGHLSSVGRWLPAILCTRQQQTAVAAGARQ